MPQAGGLAGHLDGGSHRLPVRIYYEDTDAGGIVYHASYIRFMERGRTDFLRLVGIRQSAIGFDAPTGEGVFFAVRRMEVDYLKTARLDDVVEVTTAVKAIGGARLVLDQAIRRRDELLVQAVVTIAAIGVNARPRRLPAAVLAAFGAVDPG